MLIKKKLLLLLFVLGSVGLTAQTDSTKTPRIVVKVPLGEQVVINEVSVKFDEVLEDSRCPVNVECIWEGRLKAKIIVSEAGHKPEEKIVIFGQTRGNESANKILCETTGMRIEAVKVTPYPQKAGQEMNYVLLVDRILLD